MKKPAYLSKGRTGREGSNLKLLGGLALVVGLAWTMAVLSISVSYAGLAVSIGILLAGAVLLWSGLAMAKNS